jgi:hypothetical protein
MLCRWGGVRLAWAAVLILGAGGRAGAQTVPPGLITFNDNGAWSWFEDERVAVDRNTNTILVSSVAAAAGTGGATRSGNVEIASYNVTTQALQRFTLSPNLQADDHDSAAIYVRPDGRYVASYSKHGSDNFTRWRVSSNPGSIANWTAEQTFNNGVGTTYSNLYNLSAENGGAGRLYNFTRTVGFDPNVLVSADQGSTWSYGGRLLNDTGTTSQGQRPYVRYTANGTDTIHFIATDGHPRNVATNSIYYGYIRNGQVFKSGSAAPVDANLFDGTAPKPSDYAKIFQGGPVPGSPNNGPAWTTDIQLDAAGNPYIAFSVRVTPTVPVPGKTWDHDYYYARFDGAQWQVHRMANAGTELYGAEGDYTGLVALDPSDPNRVVISTDRHPVTNDPLVSTTDGLRHWELFEGRTADGGATWAWTALTANSAVDNLRPIIPTWDAEHTALLWLRGTYTTYTNYNLDVVGIVTPVPEPTAPVVIGLAAAFLWARRRRTRCLTPPGPAARR